ncbi:1-phosphofructokinase [Clostridium sp. Cult2]|uniref:1-phosphofructokinase n=1 Tax=Clostridium sp. Cult2 TaxID=2079003 RepID=UPI001F02A836|nr:1-phosphofructokinase [Clostridium sp. Cult2]MCF6466236.1 1-phosphofructokinase [Clostridium sp. Cult2]
MIYTVTLNPAIDETIVIEEYQRNEVNRSLDSRKDVGGKGINVSKVLNIFGIDSICAGILGDENSKIFIDYLKGLNIETDFYIISGENRTNIKIVERKLGTITDINNKGFKVKNEDLEDFLGHFLSQVKEGDLVVLSGSLPKGIGNHIYKYIIESLNLKSVRVILDADGKPLLKGIEAIPYAIKPNIHELKSIVDVDEKDMNSILKGGKYLIDKGIKKVLISLGSEGAIYITEKNAYISKEIKVPIKSTVGAGDAMIAGLIYAIENNLTDFQSLKIAVACGTAKVMTEGTKIPDIDIIREILKDIVVESIE